MDTLVSLASNLSGTMVYAFLMTALSNPWALAAIVFGLLWFFQFLKHPETSDTSSIVKRLFQTSAQWNTTSVQDSNAILSLMHSNYAMAYLNVARSMATDAQIERWTKSHLDEVVSTYQDTQSKSIQVLNHMCPNTMPAGLSAVYTGWMTKT